MTVWFWAIILAGCSRRPEEIPEIKPPPPPERSYKHPTHGFVVPIPDGWDVNDTGQSAAVVLVSPKAGPADPFRENFIVQVGPNAEGYTAQQYFEESLVQRRMVSDFQLVTTSLEDFAGHEAVGAIATMSLEGLQVKVLSYTIVHGKSVYTLTAVATPESFDEFKGIFRGLALGFRPE
jgi:hypothetical protein